MSVTETTISDLSVQVRRTRRELDRQAGQAAQIAHTGIKLQAEVVALKALVATYERAVGVLSGIGETRQASAQQQIEALVTTGLQMIFSEQLSFHIVSGVSGKTPIVDFVVRSNLADGRVVETDVINARGGGLVSIVGFLLRLVVLLLSNPKHEPVLFLDETFAHLSKDYVPVMADFLRQLVDKANVQIIIVTHDEQYLEVADKKYEFSLGADGYTRVKEL